MDVLHYSYSFSNLLVDSNDEPEECWSMYGIDGPVHNPDKDVLQSHLDSMKDNCRPLIAGCNLWLMIIMESHCTWKLILSFQLFCMNTFIGISSTLCHAIESVACACRGTCARFR